MTYAGSRPSHRLYPMYTPPTMTAISEATPTNAAQPDSVTVLTPDARGLTSLVLMPAAFCSASIFSDSTADESCAENKA